jgi:hypothetical protein
MFETAKSKVSDWTQQEELDLLLKQLPDGLRLKVLSEESKRNTGKHIVKLSNLPANCNIHQVLERLGFNPTLVGQFAGCTHVRFRTQEELDRLLSLDLKLNGQKAEAMSIRDRWTSAEIFKFVSDKLRVDQENWTLSRGLKKPKDD